MSQRHFKFEKAPSFETKAISLFTLLLAVFLVSSSFTANFSVNEASNPSHLDSNESAASYFIQEEIPGKFKMLKAVIDGDEIILREDRIELLFNVAGVQEHSFLLFDDANKNAEIVGINALSETTKPIPNKAMASVLKATSMKVTKYEKVRYTNLYDGVDLELSITKGGIHAELVTLNKKSASSNFKMSVLATSEVSQNKSETTIKNAKSSSSMKVLSKNKNLIFNNLNKLQFSESTNAPENLNFDIILN